MFEITRDIQIKFVRKKVATSDENGERKRLIKNGRDRLVVLNETAQAVIEKMRGRHSAYVFSYNGTSVARIGNSAWQRARKRAGLDHLRVHDLKHTFGRRLRAAGVGFEDRQDASGKVTTHYSAAENCNAVR